MSIIADEFIKALRDRSWEIRQYAAQSLGDMECKKAVDPLIQALKDTEPLVREKAAWALGEINPGIKKVGKVVSSLMQISTDKDSNVRKAAKDALEKIKGLKVPC